eukprot:6378438-Pyramimonas_sp.AAC.1
MESDKGQSAVELAPVLCASLLFTLAHNTGGALESHSQPKNTLTLAFINGSRRPNQPMHGR